MHLSAGFEQNIEALENNEYTRGTDHKGQREGESHLSPPQKPSKMLSFKVGNHLSTKHKSLKCIKSHNKTENNTIFYN